MAKIVFCEDEPTIQKLVRVMLRSTPHELYIASNGYEGLALVERERPDIIFTDISMPVWSGFQLADALQAKPELASIPIIFITALALREDVREGYIHHAVSYLIKPFNMADLHEKIERFTTPSSPRAYIK